MKRKHAWSTADVVDLVVFLGCLVILCCGAIYFLVPSVPWKDILLFMVLLPFTVDFKVLLVTLCATLGLAYLLVKCVIFKHEG